MIEVLVALVVAVAAMALLSAGFATGARASTASEGATRAALLAQQVITEYETGEAAPTQSVRRTSGEASAESRVEAGGTGLTLVTVTVRWDERGQERKYVVTRLLRERTTTP